MRLAAAVPARRTGSVRRARPRQGLVISAQCALVAALLLGSVLAPGALGQKQQLIQLQRDVALLHDELRQLDEKSAQRLAGLEALLKQNTEKQDKLLAGQAVIERTLDELDNALTEPMRLTSAKVDALADQFSGLRAAVEEMGTSMERVHADVRDIKTHLTTLPMPLEGEEGEGDPGGIHSSEAIFEGGLSDYQRGNIDNAQGQFLDYLALYPTHSRADEAQFYLAETYYASGDYEEAIRQYEQVRKRHPLSRLTPDAMFKRGLSHRNLRDRAAAEQVLQDVIEKYPDSSVAGLARSELSSLQVSKPTPGR